MTRALKWKRLDAGQYRAFGDEHRYIIQRQDDTWFLEAKELLTISDLKNDDQPTVTMRRCGSKREATDLALELESKWGHS